MDYKRIEDTIVLRVDKGEETLEQIKNVALKENIKLANVNGLGATNDFTVCVYDVVEKKFYDNKFSGPYEITSLTGSINTMNDEFYCHLHLSAADTKGSVIGGHLKSATISATSEIFIQIINGRVDRFRDEDTGLNLFKF